MNDIAATVLVIEDEKQIRRFLRVTLEAAGFAVHEADNARQGLIEAGTRQPDLLIVDLGLPDRDGVDLIRDLRSWSSVPVIVLSARTQEADKVTALDAGADDYLTKPFGSPELLARIRAHLRRRTVTPDSEHPSARFGEVVVDLANREVTRAGSAVHLTPTEFRLLATLIRHSGKVLTHRQLLREVWGPSHIEQHHYLRIYMGNLRQKLERDPAQPAFLLTETGVGYRLAAGN